MVTSDEERQGGDHAAAVAPGPLPANDALGSESEASPAPEATPPATVEAESETEAEVGRRVESLLAEAPDADPDAETPERGDPAPEPLAEPETAADWADAAWAEAASETAPGPEPDPPAAGTTAPGPRPSRPSLLQRAGPIVAFDFDGTLTVRDSFTAFLKWREGSARYHAEMAALAPAALRYVFDRDPGKLKAAAVRRFLAGLPREVLNAEAHEFATVAAPVLFRPDALKAWRRYRQDGARLLIVTASPENIVAPFARGLGCDLLIATQLLFDPQDRVQGGLLGDNCRGPEKARRIREVLGDDVELTAAYGDTDGDWDMLDMAEQQFMRLFVGTPGKPQGPS